MIFFRGSWLVMQCLRILGKTRIMVYETVADLAGAIRTADCMKTRHGGVCGTLKRLDRDTWKIELHDSFQPALEFLDTLWNEDLVPRLQRLPDVWTQVDYAQGVDVIICDQTQTPQAKITFGLNQTGK